jgi:hypothetical protein
MPPNACPESGDDLFSATHPSYAGKNVPDGVGMALGIPSGHGVFGKDQFVPTLIRLASRAFHPKLGRNAAQDDGCKPSPPQLEVKLGSVKRSPLALQNHSVAGTAAEFW